MMQPPWFAGPTTLGDSRKTVYDAARLFPVELATYCNADNIVHLALVLIINGHALLLLFTYLLPCII
jgi:hypothetical protein